MSSIREFTEEKEAKTCMVRSISVIRNKDCPVYKTKCKGGGCTAFYAGEIFPPRGTAKEYKVFTACCMSPLITGNIEVENPF